MNRIFLLLLLMLVLPLPGFDNRRHVELEKEIQGEWLAAEFFVAQPPPELQQSIKSISFQTDNIVHWEYVQDNKMNKGEGRYGLYSLPEDKKSKHLPSLVVAPVNHQNPVLSSHILLTLSDFELDFDARFLQRWGKLIKARDPDGNRILFIRKVKESEDR
jgi:hypothetical protein